MVLEKMKALGAAASWDSCGGVKQKSLRKAKIPAEFADFIHDCSGTSESCRLVKILQSNKCVHDCKYCVNSSKGPKTEIEPEEMARGFSHFAGRGIVQGLFLSSAVTGNPEKSAGKIIETARIVRQRHGFRGYVHLKVLPGTPKHLIKEMALYANRLSLNIEVPAKGMMNELASTKDYKNDIMKRLRWIDGARGKGRLRSFTTQLILGAAGETDREVFRRMDSLYSRTGLYRTYFSAFSPIKGTPLQGAKAEDSLREHLLYQVDWLRRVYGYGRKEIESGLQEGENFSLGLDPKIAVAMNNPNWFPVDMNHATEEELIRVPGIGPKAVQNVLEAREKAKIGDARQLRELGVIARRALAFIEIGGSRQKRIAEYWN